MISFWDRLSDRWYGLRQRLHPLFPERMPLTHLKTLHGDPLSRSYEGGLEPGELWPRAWTLEVKESDTRRLSPSAFKWSPLSSLKMTSRSGRIENENSRRREGLNAQCRTDRSLRQLASFPSLTLRLSEASAFLPVSLFLY